MKTTATKIALVLSIFLNPLMASEKAFESVANEYKISKTLLEAIASVESGMNQYAIGAMPKSKRKKELLKRLLDDIGEKGCKYSSGSSLNMSIQPKNINEALEVHSLLELLDIDYDLGMTQINSWNIDRRNLSVTRLLQDVEYNVRVGAIILKECIAYNKSNIHASIECYNKGTSKKRYNKSYSNKIIQKYRELMLAKNQ